MALTITAIVRDNGAACDHLEVTVNHEGTTRTFRTSFSEVDAVSMAPEDLKEFIIRWAKYRRLQGRAIIAVSIA